MRRADFLKRAGLLLLAPTAARAIDFGAKSEALSVWITPGTGAYFAPHDIIRNQLTGELLHVTAINGDTLSLARV